MEVIPPPVSIAPLPTSPKWNDSQSQIARTRVQISCRGVTVFLAFVSRIVGVENWHKLQKTQKTVYLRRQSDFSNSRNDKSRGVD